MEGGVEGCQEFCRGDGVPERIGSEKKRKGDEEDAAEDESARHGDDEGGFGAHDGLEIVG